MAYKIIKYKGKTQIKDTKTGKFAEINIAKFMNGGYKDISNYEYGGDGDCEPGDTACIEEKRKKELFGNVDGIDYSVNPNTGFPLNKKGIVEEEDFMSEEDLKWANSLNTEDIKADKLVDPIKQHRIKRDKELEEPMKQVDQDIIDNSPESYEPNYNMPNPYGGVDIPSAANILGESIQNGNTFGIVAGGLKVATGLARNVVSGMGHANRENQVMKDYYEKQKKSKNKPVWMQNGGKIDYLAYGGKKDEELLTGEYMRGVENENIEQFNAEIEKGEYFQTNEGDIAEVVGNKHSQGGEKINMQAEDRVLSDKLKLGAKQAKFLSDKYDLKLKSKNTYSDVLDKFRKKSKLDKLVEEEAEILKKISDQTKVEDATTRNFNIQVLSQKKKDIENKKNPIEEVRKEIFDELFNIQEDSKPKNKKNKQSFQDGGKLESLAKEYGISIERATELIDNFKNGGKKVPKYGCGGYKVGSEAHTKCMEEQKIKLSKEDAESLENARKGQKLNKDTKTYGKVTPESYKASIERNSWYFKNHPEFDKSNEKQVKNYQEEYNKIANRLGKPTIQVDGKWGEQTDSINVNREYEPLTVSSESTINDSNYNNDINYNSMNPYLFPDEQPLPPEALQGTIKPQRRFDRVSASKIEIEPYLQDLRDKEQSQIQNLEGLSPNVRAAVLANLRSNTQKSESDIRNKIDIQNLQNKDRAIYTNAQIQAREENASEADRLAYEGRQYKAQSLTDNDQNNFYNNLQAINKQRFLDIHNLNLINSTNEDVYYDGQQYRRKNSDREILNNIKV